MRHLPAPGLTSSLAPSWGHGCPQRTKLSFARINLTNIQEPLEEKGFSGRTLGAHRGVTGRTGHTYYLPRSRHVPCAHCCVQQELCLLRGRPVR